MNEKEMEREKLEALQSIAKSLAILSGREDMAGHSPGPIEAIAMVLGASSNPLAWPNIGETLDSIRVSAERIADNLDQK